MKVNKIEDTLNYGCIYDVALPVRFYFNKDGSFDGVCFHVEDAPQRDKELIAELNEKLGKALGIEFSYTVERDNDEAKT